jgi:hypothetical protein
MSLAEIIAELIAVPVNDPSKWATDGDRLGALWSTLADQANSILTQVSTNSYCVAQEWDHRVDCCVRLPDGKIAGEMVSLKDLTEDRLRQTGERLRKKAAGDDVELVNALWPPVVAASLLLATCLLSAADAQPAAQAAPFRDRLSSGYSRLSSVQKAEVATLSQSEAQVSTSIQAETTETAQEFQRLNLGELVTPQFRQRDLDGALTKVRVEKARALLKDEQVERAKAYGEMADIIASSTLPAEMKSLYEEGLADLLRRTASIRTRLFELSSEEIDQTEATVALVSASDWKIVDGRYSFRSQSVARQFDDDIAKLNSLVRESAAANTTLANLAQPQ